MQKDEKTTDMTFKTFAVTFGKWAIGLVFISVCLFVIAHFAIQYGWGMGELAGHFRANWQLWLCVRVILYLTLCVFFYLLYRRSPTTFKANYFSYIRALITYILTAELIVFIHLVRG